MINNTPVPIDRELVGVGYARGRGISDRCHTRMKISVLPRDGRGLYFYVKLLGFQLLVINCKIIFL